MKSDNSDSYLVKAIGRAHLPFDGKPCKVERLGAEWVCDNCQLQVWVTKQMLGCSSRLAQPRFKAKKEKT